MVLLTHNLDLDWAHLFRLVFIHESVLEAAPPRRGNSELPSENPTLRSPPPFARGARGRCSVVRGEGQPIPP